MKMTVNLVFIDTKQRYVIWKLNDDVFEGIINNTPVLADGVN